MIHPVEGFLVVYTKQHCHRRPPLEHLGPELHQYMFNATPGDASVLVRIGLQFLSQMEQHLVVQNI